MSEVITLPAVADLAAAVRAHERGFCAAANWSFWHFGVKSPVGGMFDRASNRGAYVAVLLEDVCEDRFGRRPARHSVDWRGPDAGPRTPAAAAMAAAATTLPQRGRRRSPMPPAAEAALRAWLDERRDVMRRAEAVGRIAPYRVLAVRAAAEARRADRILARLGPASGLVAVAMAEDRAGMARSGVAEPEGVG